MSGTALLGSLPPHPSNKARKKKKSKKQKKEEQLDDEDLFLESCIAKNEQLVDQCLKSAEAVM